MKSVRILMAVLLLPAMMTACAGNQPSQQTGNANKQGSQQAANIGNQAETRVPAPTNVPATKVPAPTTAPTQTSVPAPTIAPTPAKTPIPTGSPAPAAGTYDITKATYADKKVAVNYPQLSNLSDGAKQKRINDLIKTAALEILEPYKDDIDSLSLNVDFGIKCKSLGLLSIQYLGPATVQGAAHPNNLLHTTNIDLNKERRLTLSDAVTVNDGFAKHFLSGKYRPYSSSLNLQSAGALEQTLARFSSKELVDAFSRSTAEFYFTDDSLGVSVEVAHALGDHLEMEIEYVTLGGSLAIRP